MEVRVKRVEPTQMSMFVLSPAGLWALSLSKPISPPQIEDTNRSSNALVSINIFHSGARAKPRAKNIVFSISKRVSIIPPPLRIPDTPEHHLKRGITDRNNVM
jgi:hypothetical protein